MKVIIAGGSGFIGRALATKLLAAGDEIVIVTRGMKAPYPRGVTIATWDELTPQQLQRAGAVINLAGASIAGGRWTKARKQLIWDSRLKSTAALVDAMARLHPNDRPRVFISSSAVGYYGPRGDEIVIESDGPGNDFLSQLCVAWEATARQAEMLGVRTILLRLGIVLGSGGGALPRILLPFKFFAGGPIGSGKQWWSWIHLNDVIGLIRFLISHDQASGPVNVTAPNPVTNRQFAYWAGRIMGRPAWLPVPAAALRLMLGEMADAMLLAGQRVLPAQAQKMGYEFKYPTLEAALRSILKGNTAP